MEDKAKTKKQLISELSQLRLRIKELEFAGESAQGRAERLLSWDNSLTGAIMESTGDIVAIKDHEGQYVMMNSHGADIIGRPVDEIIGKTDMDLLPRKMAGEIMSVDREIMDSGQTRTFESSAVIDGNTLCWLITKSPVIDMKGNVFGLVGIRRNITELKRLEAALNKSRNELETKVEERTAELLKANEILNREIEERKSVEEALRESEEKYRALFESSPDPLTLVGMDGKILDCNDKTAKMAGCGKEKIIGKPFWGMGVLNEEDLPRLMRIFKDSKGGNIKEPFTISITGKGEGKRWLEVFPALLKIGNKASAIQVISRDITEAKVAEDQLKHTTEQLSLMLESLPVVTYVAKLEPEGDYCATYISPNVTAITGYSPEDFTSRASFWADNIHPDDAPRVLDNLSELFEKGHHEHEYRFKVADGSYRYFCDMLRVVKNSDGDVSHLAGAWLDITERKEVEKEIKAYQEQLKFLASQLSLTEEKERRRIATYLHDNVGQLLALSRLKLGELNNMSPSTELRECVVEVRRLIDDAIGQTRSLVRELSPQALYEFGLEAAVEWLLEQLPRKQGISCHYEDDGSAKPLDDDVRITLFQSVRELVFNTIKHAQASELAVKLTRENGFIKIDVEDDGVGFSYDFNEYQSAESGFGLFNVNERISQLGGRFSFDSRPGKGARCTILAPLKKNGR